VVSDFKPTLDDLSIYSQIKNLCE